MVPAPPPISVKQSCNGIELVTLDWKFSLFLTFTVLLSYEQKFMVKWTVDVLRHALWHAPIRYP